MVRSGTLIIGTLLLFDGCSAPPEDATTPVAMDPHALVVPTDLKTWMETAQPVFVVDVRPMGSYQQGHIPGAVQAWRDAFTRNDLPYSGMSATTETMRQLLDSLGLRPEQHVVVYDDRGGCDAARLWWLLKVRGHRNVSVLDGGIPRWRASGFPVSMEWVKNNPSGYNFPDPPDSSMVATLDDVKHMTEIHRGVLLDTRSDVEHSGAEMKQGAFRAGTIPGSIHYDWGNAVAFDMDQCLKDTSILRQQLLALGVHPSDTVITFCHSGVRSAHTTFVLTQLLGMKNVRNYGGSWTEWSYHRELPLQLDSSNITTLP